MAQTGQCRAWHSRIPNSGCARGPWTWKLPKSDSPIQGKHKLPQLLLPLLIADNQHLPMLCFGTGVLTSWQDGSKGDYLLPPQYSPGIFKHHICKGQVYPSLGTNVLTGVWRSKGRERCSMEGMEDTSTRISPTQEVSGQVYWVLQGLLGPAGRDQPLAQPEYPSGQQQNWAGLLGAQRVAGGARGYQRWQFRGKNWNGGDKKPFPEDLAKNSASPCAF